MSLNLKILVNIVAAKHNATMKKITLLILYFIVSLTLTAQNYSGSSWGEAKAQGKGAITLAYVETPGFVYKDATDKTTGICIDIMNDFVSYVKSEKKVTLDVKMVGDGTNFKGMYEKVKNSSQGVFGLGNITITEERKKEVKFSPPFITNFAILITQASVPTLAKLEDLPKTFGKLTAYTAKGTLNEKRINELKKNYFPEMQITLVGTSHDTFEKITTDPNGFAYLDVAFYLEAMKQRKSVKRHPVGDKAAEQFGFIMPMNSDWYPVMDDFFKANGGYTNSAQYKNILTKHLGLTGLKLLQSIK
jgi:ABC-type amino acid transport substrate-binding protein